MLSYFSLSHIPWMKIYKCIPLLIVFPISWTSSTDPKDIKITQKLEPKYNFLI